MSGTSTETSTETSTASAALPQTAHEVASAYENASDGEINTSTPEDPPEAVPNEAAALSDPTEIPSVNPVPNSSLPDNTVPPSTPSQPSNGTLPVPRKNPQNNLRLRMKVWTDPSTLKRYLMPTAFMRDLVHGQPFTDVMYAYALSDDDTKLIILTADEWNTLPFFYFQEDGYAPRAAARPTNSLP